MADSTRRPVVTLLVAFVALLATGCLSPLPTPGDTSDLELVETRTVGDVEWRFYRNLSYSCAISGHQTFAVGTPTGQSPTDAAPLWVYLHGGGVGWFDAAGQPMPDALYKSEESLDTLLTQPAGNVGLPGLMPAVLADPAGFRLLAVSMCDHDDYGGAGGADPDNPNPDAGGAAATTSGLMATKAAVQTATDLFPTSDLFLYGGSSGAIGAYGLAWSLEQQGIEAAGVVADSGVLNEAWIDAVAAQGVSCPGAAGQWVANHDRIVARLHPDLVNPANEPDRLVGSGRLTVPVLAIWSHADPYSCGGATMMCPLPDGSTATLTAADCQHEPLRRAISAEGPTSRSLALGVCVRRAGAPAGTCGGHYVTGTNGTNTDPAGPADYNAAVMAWVHDRMADDAD